MANFVSYNNAKELMAEIGQKFDRLEGAYVYRGSIAFANLPSTLTQSMVGYIYNITNAFETDERFIDGAGKAYPAGTNVGIADTGTVSYSAVTPQEGDNPLEEGWYELKSGEYVLTTDEEVISGKTYYAKSETHVYKFDVTSGFIDVEGIEEEIQAISDMIADEFDTTAAYTVGNLVVYEGNLYKFTSAHAAGAWNSAQVTQVTVESLVSDLNTRVDNVKGSLITAFSTSVNYVIGDSVGYGDKIYKFTKNHTAGAWNPSDVAEVTIKDLIDEAEPESLTNAQIEALVALLD